MFTPPKEILVPTDFSEPSERALEQAVVLAEQFNSKIHLVHVTTQDADHMPMFFLDDEKLDEVKKNTSPNITKPLWITKSNNTSQGKISILKYMSVSELLMTKY